MIVVTGAAGFIGSCMVKKLNDMGRKDIIIVDDFTNDKKNDNLSNKDFHLNIERSDFIDWFDLHPTEISFVFHLGARTDTTEKDKAIFDELNVKFSQDLWKICVREFIPVIYASSAATYGLGENGYDDKHDILDELQPLNAYGESKNEFDKWVLSAGIDPPFWAGMKFFNVYGPNEYHKGRMASVILHTARQIKKTGEMKLFRSHHEEIADGEQSRDFVYVKDVVDVMYWLYMERPASGLYNLGTGKARTFHDLAANTFKALGKEPNISFIDTPADIRNNYQYFTEANMNKLRRAGYEKEFHSLEDGIADYVSNYLKKESKW